MLAPATAGAAELVWDGGADGVWNHANYNWRDAETGAYVTAFREGDAVVFNAPATGARVTLNEAIFAERLTAAAPLTLTFATGTEALLVVNYLDVADGVTLHNEGLLGVEQTATGSVVNAGIFATTALRGSLVNSEGAVAIVSEQTGGVITNRGGALSLTADTTTFSFETLDNGGGLVDFGEAGTGNVLYVHTLRATGGAGYYAVNVDFAARENTNRLVVTGTLSGEHRFVLTDTSSGLVALSPTTGKGLLIIETPNDADRSDEHVTGTLETGVYSYSLSPAANGAGYELGKVSYSAAGQALANTAGAVALGWFGQTDSLSKRFGDLRLQAAPVKDSLWVRGHAQRTDTDFKIEGVSEFAEYQYGADLGLDRVFSPSSAPATLVVGVFASYLSAHRVFRDSLGSRGDTDSWGVGGYAVLLAKNGLFGAVTGKFQRFENGFDTSGDTADYTNFAAGFSAEGGWKIELGKEGFFVEPAVSFDYVHFFAETYSTARRLRVLCGDSDIFRLAANLRAGKSEPLGAGGAWGVFQRYVRAGIYGQDSYGGSVRVGDFRQRPRSNGLYCTAGAGVAWQILPSLLLHAEYEAAFGDKFERPWSVNAGVRFSF